MEPTTSSEEDLLSQLPSDVLVSILEKLSLHDAVRVGVLSRRWRCLPALLPRLDLDICDFWPGKADKLHDHDNAADDDPNGEQEEDVEPAAAVENAVNDDPDGAAVDGELEEYEVDKYGVFFSDAADKMANAATALLASSRSPNNNNSLHVVHSIVNMRIHLRHNYMLLGRLLDDAVANGKVCKVQLTITTTFRMFEDDDRDYESNHRILAGYGRRFKALLDACPAVFGGQLTELTLEKMRHGGRNLDDILATCTRLEKLTLNNCGPEHGTLWRVRHAWLKEINIVMCFPKAIELEWLPRLETFALLGWFWMTERLVSLGHVPRLTTITMSGSIGDEDKTIRLSRILANAHNAALTDLRLNFCGDNIWVRPETSRRLIDAFSNLKNLTLKNVNRECGLAWTMFLLQSAPHLQQLYIKLVEHNCSDLASNRKNVPWEVDSSFKHYNLVRVTIARFYSTQETIVTFARRLIQAAINLEEICLRENAVLSCSYCDRPDPDAGASFPRTDQERDTFRKRIITDNDGRLNTAVKISVQS